MPGRSPRRTRAQHGRNTGTGDGMEGQGAHGMVVIVALIAATAVAMLLPAAVGFTLREPALARAFLYSAALLVSIAGLIFLATRNARGAQRLHPVWFMALGYLVLPALMAIPMTEAVPGMRFRDAWFEMVAAFTTTGASVIEGPGTLSVHLWRALVAWGGGLFTLVAATALLAPMKLGGFELFTAQAQRGSGPQALYQPDAGASAKALVRLRDQLSLIAPVYLGLTLVLWVALSIVGNPPLAALIVAMSTLATSGITAEPVFLGGISEVLVALLLALALCRRFWPGADSVLGRRTLRRDLELRMAVVVLGGIVAVLALRAVLGAGGHALEVWGMGFTALSFLTTTGFVSAHLTGSDGVFTGAGGMLFLALALLGGGVATTAGGLKLMRAFALFWQARHEVERLVYPASVGGDGPHLRALREWGAISAWQFLMIFIFSLLALTAIVTLTGVRFEDAVVFAVAALTTTGPLPQVAGSTVLHWSDLGDLARGALALGMVLGRLELLLLLLIVWRR